MSVSMSLTCSQCGDRLPEGAAFCPRDGTRAGATLPFGENDATSVRRNPSASPINTAQTAAPASPAPMRAAPDTDRPEGAWESTVARDVLVGQQVGDYVVTRRIGAGGMGIVYEGEHPVIGRKVAIKILRPELTEGMAARDLIAEARAASAIRHRGIIDVFGFGTLPGIGQYLVMEYLEGTPLNELISKHAPLAEAEAIALLDELLGALAAAHSVGVIHRDLKPGNIFVATHSGGTQSVKVLDFGLAKRSEVPHGSTPQTRASLIVGTPEYIAPEQANGQAVGPHTDLYAVGLIAFELLTRRLPFEGASPMALILQHIQKEPPAPSTFVELHPRLDALVLQLLAKEPSQRPASAEAVQHELKLILQLLSQGEKADSPPSSSPTLPRVAGSRSEQFPATMVRPTPQVPLSARNPRSQPVTGSQRPVEEAPSFAPTDVTAAEPQGAPRPARRGLLGVAAGAAVVLAALGGWLIRGPASPGDVPPAVAPAVTPPEASAQATAIAPVPVPPPPPPQAVPAEPQAPPAVAAPVTEQPPAEAIPRSKSAKKKKRKGTLNLDVRGAGAILVDGRYMGTVPPNNILTLPEGPHRLEIRNKSAQPYQANITITADQQLKHLVTLQPLGKP